MFVPRQALPVIETGSSEQPVNAMVAAAQAAIMIFFHIGTEKERFLMKVILTNVTSVIFVDYLAKTEFINDILSGESFHL